MTEKLLGFLAAISLAAAVAIIPQANAAPFGGRMFTGSGMRMGGGMHMGSVRMVGGSRFIGGHFRFIAGKPRFMSFGNFHRFHGFNNGQSFVFFGTPTFRPWRRQNYSGGNYFYGAGRTATIGYGGGNGGYGGYSVGGPDAPYTGSAIYYPSASKKTKDRVQPQS